MSENLDEKINDKTPSNTSNQDVRDYLNKDFFLRYKLTGEHVDKVIKIPDIILQKDVFIECKGSSEFIEFFEEEVTGSEENIKKIKIIEYPFDKYIVKVGISSSNEFLGITEIEINEDFRSPEERNKSKPFYDVDEYYPE